MEKKHLLMNKTPSQEQSFLWCSLFYPERTGFYSLGLGRCSKACARPRQRQSFLEAPSPPFWTPQEARLWCPPALPFPAPSCLPGGTHVDNQAVFLSYFVPSSSLFLLPPLFPHVRASIVVFWTVSRLRVSRTSPLHPTSNHTATSQKGWPFVPPPFECKFFLPFFLTVFSEVKNSSSPDSAFLLWVFTSFLLNPNLCPRLLPVSWEFNPPALSFTVFLLTWNPSLSPCGRLLIAFPESVFSFKSNSFGWAWGYPVKNYISQTPFPLGVVMGLCTSQHDMGTSNISNFPVISLKRLSGSSWPLSPCLPGWQWGGLERSLWTHKWKPHIGDRAERLGSPTLTVEGEMNYQWSKASVWWTSLVQQLSLHLISSSSLTTVLLIL